MSEVKVSGHGSFTRPSHKVSKKSSLLIVAVNLDISAK